VRCSISLLEYHGWSADDVSTRIVGHHAQAIWTPALTNDARRCSTLGRKVDPTGTRPDKQPIIDVAEIHRRVLSLLSS